jgi:hypothetical protein
MLEDRAQPEESNMRVINRFTTSIAASLLLAAVAHASDAGGGANGTATKFETVPVTGLPWNVATYQRVSSVTVQHPAEPHRTAKIGTGTAAATVRVVESLQPVSPANPSYPAPLWSSTIGTGGAAALEH